jgi:hypothetical protein
LFLLRLQQDAQLRHWRTNLGEELGNGQNPLVQLQLMKVSGIVALGLGSRNRPYPDMTTSWREKTLHKKHQFLPVEIATVNNLAYHAHLEKEMKLERCWRLDCGIGVGADIYLLRDGCWASDPFTINVLNDIRPGV